MSEIYDLPLRERKKAQTRLAISGSAIRLFGDRGFNEVTIDEVAAAAEVSKKTVFNYFACKEDLLFAGSDAAEARLVAEVRTRAEGKSILDASREQFLQAVKWMCSGDDPWVETMAQLVSATPSLQAREAEIFDHLARALAQVIREETGARPGDTRPDVAARAIVAVQRSVAESARKRVLRGQRGRALARALRTEVERSFELLESGLSRNSLR